MMYHLHVCLIVLNSFIVMNTYISNVAMITGVLGTRDCNFNDLGVQKLAAMEVTLRDR